MLCYYLLLCYYFVPKVFWPANKELNSQGIKFESLTSRALYLQVKKLHFFHFKFVLLSVINTLSMNFWPPRVNHRLIGVRTFTFPNVSDWNNNSI